MNAAPFGYVKTAGDSHKPALVFLHGGGLSSREWEPQFAALSGEFYCVAPDLPEQGQSADIRPFTLADSANRVVMLIEGLPAQRAHVIGLSLGGAVALAAARTAPECVDHLMVSGTSAGLSRWLGWLTIASAGMYRWFSRETLLKMAYQQFNIPEQYRELLRDDLIRSFDADFTRHFTEALMDISPPDQAKALVMVGERETPIARRDARKLVQCIQGAKGVIVPGVGHVWNLEAPDLFNDTVRAFVTDAALPAALRPIQP
jgi:pimeloyl-ACP methyl ester carboxylesterase